MSTRDRSFNSFLVDEGNRHAYDLCLAVARGEPIAPLPLVLSAAPGCGKTHLLHAITGRLRASVPHAAIISLNPTQFPSEARALVDDPDPIDRARYAVLLIDDIDRFDDPDHVLERLVEIFLENDHPVVIATQARPERLGHLSDTLRSRLLAGQLVELAPGDAQKELEVVEARVRDETAETIEGLEMRIAELESGDDDTHAGRSLARAYEQTETELREARHEIEQLRAESALREADGRAASALRARVEQLEEERVRRAEDPVSDSTDGEGGLKRELSEARHDVQKAREEAREMLGRAQHLIEELQQNRSDFETAAHDRYQFHSEIEKLDTIFRGAVASTGSHTEPEGSEVETADDSNPPSEQPLQKGEDLFQADMRRLQESLVRAHAERDTAKSHLAHIRESFDDARRDLDDARERSEADLAERDARIRSLEESLVERGLDIERLQSAQQAANAEMHSLREQLDEGTDVLERLMHLFGVPAEARESFLSGDNPPDTGAGEAHEIDAPGEARSEDTPDRADFGDGLRSMPPGGASLHHIEELRSGLDILLPESLPPLEDEPDEDGTGFQDQSKTA